jgi:hypothetical protein
MKGSGPWIAGAVLIVLVCMAAGCTGIPPSKSGNGTNISGKYGTIGETPTGWETPTGGSSTADYVHDAYFSLYCTGEWKVSGSGVPDSYGNYFDHHGKFKMSGNVPIIINLDYHETYTPIAYFDPSSSPGANHIYSPIHINGESWDTQHSKLGGDKTCHLTWDGYIQGTGIVYYDPKKSSEQQWTVSLYPGAFGTDLYRTNSFSGEGNGCDPNSNKVDYPAEGDIESETTHCFPAYGEYTPFTFRDGSNLIITKFGPATSTNTIEYTSFNPNVIFNFGKPPAMEKPTPTRTPATLVSSDETLPPLVETLPPLH